MRLGFLSFLCLFIPAAFAADDPLKSPRWNDMRKLYFEGKQVAFDERVKVVAPKLAEDSMNVPVAVDAKALNDVEEILVFADFNPILKVLQYYPQQAQPYIAFRLKLEQSSPVRAAVRTRDGVWHVGGTWVEAAGGGCTAPSAGRASGSWSTYLNQVHGRLFERREGGRVRVKVMHPMDTGLAPGIPAFYIERLSLADERGDEFARLLAFEPVSENPVFTFDFPSASRLPDKLFLTGADNNGNKINAGINTQ